MREVTTCEEYGKLRHTHVVYQRADVRVTCSRGRQQTQASKSFDTPERDGYALPMRLLPQGPALDADPSAHRGDVYDQGRARRPRGRHRAAPEVPDRRGAHAVLAGPYGRPARPRRGPHA